MIRAVQISRNSAWWPQIAHGVPAVEIATNREAADWGKGGFPSSRSFSAPTSPNTPRHSRPPEGRDPLLPRRIFPRFFPEMRASQGTCSSVDIWRYPPASAGGAAYLPATRFQAANCAPRPLNLPSDAALEDTRPAGRAAGRSRADLIRRT